MISRPLPPPHLQEIESLGAFEPAPDVVEWIHATFLDEKSPLFDESHLHLLSANIGVLWTNAVNVTKQVAVVGTAELPKPHPALGKWGKARHEWQMRQWFGGLAVNLDFLITLYAPYMMSAGDMEFCAIAKHELCHCAQALDRFQQPKFRKSDGRPVFAIRDHDFAGFLANVRDFGPGAERNVPELIEVVKAGPRIASIDVSRMCGTCLLRAV